MPKALYKIQEMSADLGGHDSLFWFFKNTYNNLIFGLHVLKVLLKL